MTTDIHSDSIFHSFMDPAELDGDAAFFVRFLDTMQETEGIQQNHRRVREFMQLDKKSRFLDVGCGTGNFLIETAPMAGQAVGLDQSEALLGVANSRARAAGVEIETHLGDAMQLPFDTGSFDAVRTERVLQYLPDPMTGVREMVRVAKRGGRVVATEVDWDGIFNDVPGVPRHIWRRVITVTADNSGNPWMGRELERHFRQAGLVDIRNEPFAIISRNHDRVMEDLGFGRSISRAVQIGAIAQEEADLLIQALAAAREEDRSFSGGTLFTVAGTKS